jgi:hypothetical protein
MLARTEICDSNSEASIQVPLPVLARESRAAMTAAAGQSRFSRGPGWRTAVYARTLSAKSSRQRPHNALETGRQVGDSHTDLWSP